MSFSDEKPMRVLMTADTIGGVWTYALEVMETVGGSGVRFALATMGRRLRGEQRDAVEALPNVELFESDYKLEWMNDPWEEVGTAGRWLLEIERAWKPDVVHLNGYAHGALPWRAPVLIVAHSCVFSWFAGVRRTPPPAAWDRYRRHVRRGLEAANLVVAPSRAMLAALSQHYGDGTARGAVIPNGRNPSQFREGEKLPYILTAGRIWDEGKNIALLDAIARDLPWPTFAAGECTDPHGKERQPGTLRCLGLLAPAQLADWLGAASIYALPAFYEPFGLSALEAGLSGCALVLADIPSLRETWEGAALFAPPNDPERWREMVTRLANSPPLRRKLSSLARHRALGLTSEWMGRAYHEVYLSLTTQGDTYEDRSVLPLSSLGLESRQRPFPPGIRKRARKTRPRRLRV